MRIEQIIATVTRTLVVANVREICRVVSFAAASRLHLWQMRMPLGMPCYQSALYSGDLWPSIPQDDADHRMRSTVDGSKRGKQPGQRLLATANCRWKTATA